MRNRIPAGAVARPVSFVLSLWLGTAALSAGELVLKNGRVIHCEGPFEVKADRVEYRDKLDNLYYVPLDAVDMARSRAGDKKQPASAAAGKKESRRKGDLYDSLTDDRVSAKNEPRHLTDATLSSRPGSTVPYGRADDVYWAIQVDDMDRLRAVLRPGLGLDKPLSYRRETPLQLAISKGNVTAVGLLLDAGVNPNVRNPYGETALMAALRRNTPSHRTMVPLLLKAGADPNLPDFAKATPLHAVLSTRNTFMLEALIDYKVNLDVRDPFGMPPLIAAVHGNDAASLTLLLKAGADLDARGTSGSNALLEAVKSSNPKLLEVLTQFGADINTLVGDVTPLMLAVGGGDLSMTRTLLQMGARPDLGAPGGDTPAVLAVRGGFKDLFSLLLQHDVDIHAPPLVPEAVKAEQVVMLRTLLKLGGDPDALDRKGEPALILAARSGNLVMVQALIAAGAEPSAKSTHGFPAYLEATGPRKEQIQKVLRAKINH